ncbi:C45 family autoproteolytic acyltransferase/hydolase [Winogradskyella sp. MH6]|uniref:C45 family autoproteolytic acyltransferase/hydolase n=1 Tax=Winogradskyella sp. MH6 TaxID=2929510 RepID=UPI001FB383D5|nr:C45 family autoproteolytic acyltransferase/hydolase [Winogradskyella sp. MH6]
MERITINLDKKPSERWNLLKDYKHETNSLLKYYLEDLSSAGIFETYIETYKTLFISKQYQEEIECVAKNSHFSENQVLITNLYYDALKFVFGCTSFCITNQTEKLHARNLDWWSENNILGSFTKVFDFKENDEIKYSLVSWPGFIGALSGVKPGKFSITLNAVLSNESPQFAIPITFLIRDVLENAETFDEAIKILSETTIASDCLLMVVGVNLDENVVIERTPTTFSIRKPEGNSLIVTNEYLSLTENKNTNDTLQLTASGRHKRVEVLVKANTPKSTDDYFDILSDNQVKMGITVQQMVFNPKNGDIHLKV